MNSPKCLPLLAGRGPLRALVGLLSLVLVPVLIVTTPQVAAAATATKYSGTVTPEIRWDSMVPGDWASCSWTVFYDVTGDASADSFVQSVKTTGGDCETGAGRNLEGGTASYEFTGLTGNAAPCTATASGSVGTDEALGNVTAWAASSAVPSLDLCTVTQMCVSFAGSHWSNDWALDRKCVPVSMGAPQLPGGSTVPSGCIHGQPLSVTVVYFNQNGATSGQNGQVRVNFAPGANKGANNWRAELAMRGAGGELVWLDNGTSAWSGDSLVFTFAYRYPTITELATLAGVDFSYYVSTADNTNWSWTPPLSLASPEGGGWTVPSRCKFYFGDKIAPAYTGDDREEPANPLGGPAAPVEPEPANPAPTPKPEDEGCTEGFSIWNPLSWASAGFCEVVSGLASLVKLVRGFVEGFIGWFQPDKGYLNGRVDQTKDALNDTTPGKWLDSFTDLTPGEVSGCGGMQVAPPNPAGEGTMFDVQLGAACSGSMANIAGLVRIAISAAVVIGGGLACIRALGSGFGWSPGVGRGESV